MHAIPRHARRQEPPSVPGLGGAETVSANGPPPSSLILGSGSGSPTEAPPLASGFTPTVVVTSPQTPTSDPISPSPTPSQAEALKSNAISMSAVIAACVGAFIGLALLICIFIWWTRHSTTKSRRAMPRSPMSENRNAHGEAERQGRVRSGAWNKLGEDKWESTSPVSRQMSQQEVDEKNFSMFKKRTASMRTTRTAKALEEHGIDMPPITKYHPDLAEELALEQPDRPFTQRQDSGISWDGETVGDDSFLSLRSVRIESGTMSPTLGVAKMTPPAVSSQLHRWESAEVLTLDESVGQSAEVENPFTDAAEDRRKSRGVNPFFSAGEVNRTPSRRDRSNSRGHSHNRNASTSRARNTPRAQVVSQADQIDPFADISRAPIEDLPTHQHTDSTASNSSAYGNERAMKSLIAALDLTQEEVEERLRAVSMQPSLDSRYSALFKELEDDVGIVRQFPPTPTGPKLQ